MSISWGRVERETGRERIPNGFTFSVESHVGFDLTNYENMT